MGDFEKWWTNYLSTFTPECREGVDERARHHAIKVWKEAQRQALDHEQQAVERERLKALEDEYFGFMSDKDGKLWWRDCVDTEGEYITLNARLAMIKRQLAELSKPEGGAE